MKKSLDSAELALLVKLYENGELADSEITDTTSLHKLTNLNYARHTAGIVTLTPTGRHYYQSVLGAAIALRRALGD